MVALRGLLDGPALREGAERWDEHQRRLGPLPGAAGLLERLEASGLRGRGGAAFPVARKWQAVVEHGHGRAVVLVNGAEGESMAHKDRVLLAARPNLVLDGALLAAAAVGARHVVVYVGAEHEQAMTAVAAALAERHLGPRSRPSVEIVGAPAGYVAGEETAAVRVVNGGPALPTMRPPRPFERGVGGRSTLVQNVETLAAVALLARGLPPASLLLTVSGAVAAPGVLEVPFGTTVGEVATRAGGTSTPVQAVLLGGAGGAFLTAEATWELPLEPARIPLGAGVLALVPASHCGVAVTAELLTEMAGASAGQCGPCRAGLPAIASALRRLALGEGDGSELLRLRRWAGMVDGRGVCGHPGAASRLVRSALETFALDFATHEQHGRCRAGAPGQPFDRRRIA